MSTFAVGSRRSYNGQRCTIRFVGPLEGTTGEWLGIEWDDPTRGKHSGEHKGAQYFVCMKSTPIRNHEASCISRSIDVHHAD